MCKIDLDAEIQAARERVAGYGELAAPGDVTIVRLADEVAGRSSPAPVGGGVPELTSEEIIAHFRKSLPVGAASADDDKNALEWCFKDCRWAYGLAASRLPALKPGEVVVNAEELRWLRHLHKWMEAAESHHVQVSYNLEHQESSRLCLHEITEALDTLDALRAHATTNEGGAEHV